VRFAKPTAHHMDFDFSVVTDHWRFLASGVGITLLLSVVSGLTSLVAGLFVALLRLYGPRVLRAAVVLYIDSMRAIPVLVVLVWTFFALPILTGLTMPPFVAALVGLTVHLAAYAAEIVRAGVESVRPGQTRAALALGMSRAQIVRRIVLPQAIVRMLPAFGSLLSITIKDTAIASVIAVPELMRQSETLAGQSFQPIEVYTFAMLVYFVVLFPVTRGIDMFYQRVAHLGRS
jgi:polar amino acid transport system permease protein